MFIGFDKIFLLLIITVKFFEFESNLFFFYFIENFFVHFMNFKQVLSS